MASTMYAVEGMICESCMAAVIDTVHSLPGVSDVAMDLVTGGRSPLIVTSRTKLGADVVRDAIGHVGFEVPPRSQRVLPDGGVGPAAHRGDPQPDRQPTWSSIGGSSS